MNLDKITMRNLMYLITFTVFLIALIFNVNYLFEIIGIILSIIFPFILGCCIAFILNLPMNFYEDKLFKSRDKISRSISLVLSLISIAMILCVVMLLVVPELVNTISTITNSMNDFIPRAKDWLMNTFDHPAVVSLMQSIELNWESIFNEMITLVQSGASSMIASSYQMTASFVSFVINLLVAIIFAIYILLQKETLYRHIKKVLYAFLDNKYVDKIYRVSSLSYNTFCNFIAGQCLEAMILGGMFFVSMILLKMPYALLVGVLLCVTALIPIVGGFIGCFVGAFLIFIQNPTQALVFIVLFVIIQQIEGNLIYPYVVGNSVGLPSIWVLFSVTVGGSLFGIVGMLIAIPIVSIVYTLFKEFVNKKLKEKDLGI